MGRIGRIGRMIACPSPIGQEQVAGSIQRDPWGPFKVVLVDPPPSPTLPLPATVEIMPAAA